VRSGTIEVMACRFFLVSRGFRRRKRSLGVGGQLGSPCMGRVCVVVGGDAWCHGGGRR
jgi:hypothetical protein